MAGRPVTAALGGSTMGLRVARAAFPAVLALTGDWLQDIAPHVDLSTAAFTLLLAIVFGLLIGIAPVVSGMGLLLAAVGLDGVLAYAVSYRRAEFAVRVALGATPGNLATLVLTEASRVVFGGMACGMLLARIAANVVRAWLFGVRPSDPLTLVLVAVTVSLVGLVAACQPVLRAMRTDASRSIHGE
jgi:ABC-type antimicrobial peptide transport system permease subunit